MHWISHLIDFLRIHFIQESGTNDSASRGYNFWSGFGSDLGEITLIGAVITAYHHTNCESRRCPRFGKHKTADGMHKLCRHHHPDLMGRKRTLEEIHEAHRLAKEKP